MKRIWLIALFATASSAVPHGEPDLRREHTGGIFWGERVGNGDGDVEMSNSTGVTTDIGGESAYVSAPRHGTPKAAILYLTDIFGNDLVNNRLLADSFAEAGYLVVMPDLFRGDPVPADALSSPESTFNLSDWQTRHPTSQIDEIVTTSIDAIRNELNVSKVAAAGYCFGGKFVARFLAEGGGLDAGYTAHPSNTLEDEWAAIKFPIAIGFGALDDLNTSENRTNIESILDEQNATYQTTLYAGAPHGFAVRANLTDKKEAFAQQSAYFQAVTWFDAWLYE